MPETHHHLAHFADFERVLLRRLELLLLPLDLEFVVLKSPTLAPGGSTILLQHVVSKRHVVLMVLDSSHVLSPSLRPLNHPVRWKQIR